MGRNVPKECCEERIKLWSWTNRKEEAGREKTRSEVVQ